MIENERQYEIIKLHLNRINQDIDKVTNDINQHPLRNKLMLAALINTQKELTEEISLYKSTTNELSR